MIINLKTLEFFPQEAPHNEIRSFAYLPEGKRVGLIFYRDTFQSELVLYDTSNTYSSENQAQWQYLDSMFGREAWQEFLRRFEIKMVSKEEHGEEFRWVSWD